MISIVVPVYNEEKNVLLLYEELVKVLNSTRDDYEIIFVDDGSADGTPMILRDLHQANPQLKVVRLRKNFGQSAAVAAGFDHAAGEIVITMDGDLQNDPEDIPKLLKGLEEGYDVVCGWRHQRKDPLSKKISSRISNWLARKMTGLRIHDFGCTLRAYRREAVEDLELYGELHRYVPAMIHWNGFSVTEVKVQHHPRKHGKTKYTSGRLLKGFLDLLLVKFLGTYSSRPLHIFGLVGVGLALIGATIGAYLTIAKYLFGTPMADRPLLILAILLIIIGIQTVSFGFISQLVTRVYYSLPRKKPYQVEREE